jgi:ATP-dependent DNA ligase
MLWRPRTSTGYIEPCQPSPCPRPPSGDRWLHEIKHDGYRLMVLREGSTVRLYTRNGHDWADRFPSVVAAALALKATRFLIDGEVMVAGPDGRAVFELLRRGRQIKPAAFLCAFDLIVVEGDDLRSHAIEDRKAQLAHLLERAGAGLQFNEHIDGQDGATVFAHACKLGCEGIVSKLKGSHYRSGRSRDWLKSKNPASAAVRREATEDWGKRR